LDRLPDKATQLRELFIQVLPIRNRFSQAVKIECAMCRILCHIKRTSNDEDGRNWLG
jgi:hypothetical protein